MARKALFLDRDGVINRERGDYTYLPEHLEVLPDIAEVVRAALKKDYLVIVITNQGGIAKRRYTQQEMEYIHSTIQKALTFDEGSITNFYFCPHHENTGKCLCRKPGSLLLEKAIARFDIDREQSLMVGDSERDIVAAEAVGVKGIKVESNESTRFILNIL